jgi:UPF0176 protein
MNDTQIAVLSFYAFVPIEDIEILMPKMLLIGKKKSLKGTILLAHEGFNGSISGNKIDAENLINELAKITNAEEVSIKVNYCADHPFQKFKVKIKKEIVALGVGEIDVSNLKGEYIETKDWDNFISRDDVIVVDTRNDYEVEIGTFKKAINPNTETFKDFPEWALNNKNLFEGKKIAMYCTGGIRCEKSTAYMKMPWISRSIPS